MQRQECQVWIIIKMGLMFNESCRVGIEISAIRADCQDEHSPSQKQLRFSLWRF